MSAGGDNTDIDTTSVRSGAHRLTEAGSAAQSTWTSAIARIEALHASKPWGADEAGMVVENQYYGGESGAQGFAGEGDQGGGGHVKRLAELGPGIVKMVDQTVSADDLVASWWKL